jgi:hypothetical protein
LIFQKLKNIPWCSIAKSMPNYAIIVSNVTSDWGAYTLLTNIPSYISDVLKFDIASVSIVLFSTKFFVLAGFVFFFLIHCMGVDNFSRQLPVGLVAEFSQNIQNCQN